MHQIEGDAAEVVWPEGDDTKHLDHKDRNNKAVKQASEASVYGDGNAVHHDVGSVKRADKPAGQQRDDYIAGNLSEGPRSHAKQNIG